MEVEQLCPPDPERSKDSKERKRVLQLTMHALAT